MPDFMAEMSEQRAIGFMHLHADSLALGIVGFHQVDGNQPVVMSGDDTWRFRIRRIGEEVESQTLLGILVAVFMWQVEAQQTVKQAVLGAFDAAPV